MRILYLSLIMIASLFFSCSSDQHERLTSPDGLISITINCKNHTPYYNITYRGDTVIKPSHMGFNIKDMEPLQGNFAIIKSERNHTKTQWKQPWGENKIVTDHHNSIKIYLKERGENARYINIEMRAFNDGVAFRYEFPHQKNLTNFTISDELTTFTVSGNPTTWWAPADYDSYEKLYNKTPLEEAKWVATPVTMKLNDNCYISIHEADLIDFADMTLKQDETGALKADLTPWGNGDKVRTEAPRHTPWRTIQISPTAAKLVESTMILNLNEPSKIEDTEWIKPMKYIGVWWGMHLGTETWHAGPRHGANTENALKHIDFAAENNIQGVVFEGWNAGWENWGGKDAFDHITPAKDFDLLKVAQYAKDKGVMIIGHHETGGDIPAYEEYMKDAFTLCRDLGINAVKTGYAGGIYPRGEYHHGQFMVNHYRKVVETAAKYHIMLDVHEPIKPTGERRTWPNMMTREGVRGMEWNAWSEGNPPSHTVILPFTRGLAGPTDYTPGTFDVLFTNAGEREKWNSDDISKTRVHTTISKQLANFVILYSPLQMASDLIKNYENHPAFKFIADYNADIDESKVLNGEIGEYITIARRAGEEWFLGSATNEEARTITITTDFLDANKPYSAIIYRDADDANWQNNPTAYVIENIAITKDSTLELKLAPGGGQAIHFKPIKQ